MAAERLGYFLSRPTQRRSEATINLKSTILRAASRSPSTRRVSASRHRCPDSIMASISPKVAAASKRPIAICACSGEVEDQLMEESGAAAERAAAFRCRLGLRVDD